MIQNSYKQFSADQLEEIFSRFLISSWSYSAATQFARNELVFEMRYIYREQFKKAASAVAGDAYHEALKAFFLKRKENIHLDIVDLEQIAFAKISSVPANDWKIQKTTPSVLECVEAATKAVSKLLLYFFREVSIYVDEIEEILDVELYMKDFIVLNGVEIPLPASGVCDLVVLLKDGRVVIIDHKSKTAHSDEEEAAFIMGTQGITYYLLYGAVKSIWADEIWFIENKVSENRDKSPQLVKFPVVLNSDVIATYEYMLYEPVKRMLEAVSDPDHIYLMNESDNFVSKAEQYDFMFKRMIPDMDFNIDESKKHLIELRQKKIKDSEAKMIPPKLIKQFRDKAAAFIQYDFTNKDMENSEKIEHVLKRFNLPVEVEHNFKGFSSDTYLLRFEPGIKISSIHSHALDIASALNVPSVRISRDLSVYNEKAYLSVEHAKKREKDLIFDAAALVGKKIPLGMDNLGNTIVWDIENHSTTNALVCGSVGSGKTASMISTIEYLKLAEVEDIVIFDPKFEFSRLNISGVQVFSEIEDIENKMRDLVIDMNERIKSGAKKFTAVIFDEFKDACDQAKSGKKLDIFEMQSQGFYRLSSTAIMAGAEPQEKTKLVKIGVHKSLEENLGILAQKGRSSGFRIMIATQRASVKVISGDIKNNFPVQICFKVPKAIDSMVVLDEAGAESLGGMGDGLIKSADYPETTRFQAYYFKN